MSDVNLAKPTDKKPAARKTAPKKPDSKPFASVDDIKLGMIVRDPATGLKGVATMRCQMLSGCVQYAIQPQGEGDKVPEGHFIDDFILEFVAEGVSAKVPKEDLRAAFRVGEELEDTVTGFRGIAIERTAHLNGCVHYTLQPEKKKLGFLSKLLGEPPRATNYDYKRLKKVSDGVARPVPKVVKAPAAAVAAPAPPSPPPFKRSGVGGPTRSAAGYSQRA